MAPLCVATLTVKETSVPRMKTMAPLHVAKRLLPKYEIHLGTKNEIMALWQLKECYVVPKYTLWSFFPNKNIEQTHIYPR